MSMTVLERLGLDRHPRVVTGQGVKHGVAGQVVVTNPATGRPIAAVILDDERTRESVVAESCEAFRAWREVPAPARGQVVRAIGDEFRRHKEALGELISLEVGKIRQEGLGEVQETIDIADYAVGLSRTLSGPVLQSERPRHRLYEQWLPLGPIGVISAFNFPNAVWAWNAMIAAVCGDVVIWKPSLLAPLTAIASNAIAERVSAEMGHPGVFRLLIGTDTQIAESLVEDRRLPLISATGSCRMGRRVGEVVARRLGRSLLELGGNNAVIVHSDADLDLAARSILFGAVGTAGQRCTTTRRLIAHESVAAEITRRLAEAYGKVAIGDPLNEGTLVGPLITPAAVETFLAAIRRARDEGGEVVAGGERASGLPTEIAGGNFVRPAIVRAPSSNRLPIALEETFAPILYVFTYRTLDEALAMHNGVDQGLASGIFTDSLAASETFLSVTGSGSDCGLAYVNLGTSGAEIGGAFGGEKDTGGGRESGSDSWKAYMRRQTVAVNHGKQLALAQGIRFGE
ncbi:MAG: aldehyde dehydrogenase family protein [Phycisphaeraceae bacterium]|nr:aldehyde dehydrogenase family protein [Phycisphaeraceae bacterium]